ncbi:hypothetical protein [Peribacillus butanolivorans]|uniref:hypothetical protein n=1 Tax=Peribacillus butanolivorans TaxID=421767 RepID=UPI0035E37C18
MPGELAGYSYQVGGKKTEELEEFFENSKEASEAAITPELKEVVKDNFEYFDKIINNDYFYKSRNAEDPNDPMFDKVKEDDSVTEEIQTVIISVPVIC